MRQIIGGTGSVSKSLDKHLHGIPGNLYTRELQNMAILRTEHLLRKTLI